jgi:hypothetical protein
MTLHCIANTSNMKCVTNGTGTTSRYGVSDFIPGFELVGFMLLNPSFLCSVLLTIVCLFVPFLLFIVMFVLLFMTSDYHFGIFKLLAIVMSVLRFMTSDYLFGTFSLIPLYYLSLDLRLLITSLVLFL